MSETNSDNDQLESLQQMLEAEMRGNAEPEAAPEKPTVVETKADDLGSLLGDLLSEAEKEVGRERTDLSGTLNESGTASRPPSDRAQTRDFDHTAQDRAVETALDELSTTIQDTVS